MHKEPETPTGNNKRTDVRGDAAHRLTFKGSSEFQVELRRRIDEYFKASGKGRRDVPQYYLKAAVFLTLFGLSYGLLVLAVPPWWAALPLAAILGLSMAGIGFNIMHDGGHGAASQYAWVNKVMALSLDLVGGSSYLWRWKHTVIHHTYVNITGEDTDIELAGLGRMSPYQRRRWFHRWQHDYIWLLYGLMAMKWHLYDDFRDVLTGRIGAHPIARPRGWDLLLFLGGKVVFFGLACGLPLVLHPLWVVGLYYIVTAGVLGLTLSTVFQLAHGVEEAAFPMPAAGSRQMQSAWAVHQVESTVDFARNSRIAAWLLGGLNFQIEHHLFPAICHINYPAMSKIVEATCRDFQIEYHAHKTFLAGIVSHARWLRRMGQADLVELPSA